MTGIIGLLVILSGASVGALVGYAAPRLFEDDASRKRGSFMGLKVGINGGVATMFALLCISSFAWYWTLPLFIVAFATAGIATTGIFKESKEKTVGIDVVDTFFDVFALSAFAYFCYQLGFGGAAVSTLLGTMGGYITGALLFGGRIMDFLQSFKGSSAKQNFAFDSGYHGFLLAPVIVGMGGFAAGSVVIVFGSFIVGCIAGSLTALGKYSKRTA